MWHIITTHSDASGRLGMQNPGPGAFAKTERPNLWRSRVDDSIEQVELFGHAQAR